ncbi:GNAT family N-acetyltransferase [Porphyromonas pogonae]|uniref:GNAT family N-acetyltransferase n=1 Tax=Porphyromonas pogonae TaxID=867595 RepID=UPI002E783D67|nr:GNAT family N-acetyltransferase [Porphyromonas pogonae]
MILSDKLSHITLKEYHRLSDTEKDYAINQLVHPVYHQSFPEHERRPWTDFTVLLDTEPDFTLFIVYATETEAPVGFVTRWNIDNWVYIEHFAIDHSHRNKGFGAMVINAVKSLAPSSPLVLEAEPHDGLMASRRIRFYERLGFQQMPFDYFQPPYRPTAKSVPLVLMATVPADRAEISRIADLIHHKVYRFH